MSFSFYAEPSCIVGDNSADSRTVFVGIGSHDGDDDRETVAIGVYDRGEESVIHLAFSELRVLIADLSELADDLGMPS